MKEELKKLNMFLSSARGITIMPSKETKGDSFPASLALFYSLKNLGKNVNLAGEKYPKKFSFLSDKEDLFTSKGNFLVSIKEKGGISGIFYEKTEEGLNLYLKTNKNLSDEDIKLESIKPEEGLLITVGIESFKETKDVLPMNPKEIIAIDNNEESERFGGLNIINPGVSLSEIMFDIIKEVSKESIDKKVANSLLAGIIHHTSNFTSPEITPTTLKKATALSRRGNINEVVKKLNEINPESSFFLFRRIMEKLNFSKDKNLVWATLKDSDFTETGSTPKELNFAFEKIVSNLFPSQDFLCLWENRSSPLSIWGVFRSLDKDRIKILEKEIGGQKKGNGIMFQTKDKNLEKVKERILDNI